MRSTNRASNGTNHLGLCALQAQQQDGSSSRMGAELLRMSAIESRWRHWAAYSCMPYWEIPTALLPYSCTPAQRSESDRELRPVSHGLQLQPLWMIPAAAVS